MRGTIVVLCFSLFAGFLVSSHQTEGKGIVLSNSGLQDWRKPVYGPEVKALRISPQIQHQVRLADTLMEVRLVVASYPKVLVDIFRGNLVTSVGSTQYRFNSLRQTLDNIEAAMKSADLRWEQIGSGAGEFDHLRCSFAKWEALTMHILAKRQGPDCLEAIHVLRQLAADNDFSFEEIGTCEEEIDEIQRALELESQ